MQILGIIHAGGVELLVEGLGFWADSLGLRVWGLDFRKAAFVGECSGRG